MLLVWQPVSLAIVASGALEAVPIRGVPLVLVLVARLLATSGGIAAGLALAGRRSHAVALAKTSLIASAATDLFTYTTPSFPNNRPPGGSAVVVATSMIYYASWLAYLFLSRRVKNTY